ncbi:FUSC family protein [Vibrio superstes]|uniref:FUSC family protein n=1 Tax=Vibrio superstes NBRC 103154 TaxID=1219062 RepID=A0A511QMV4_9VIBR|nr:FUSC family protein [Vibrio superstes]GEM78296.1 FUSC family protein [Vibrio superstes NBRC 103154]
MHLNQKISNLDAFIFTHYRIVHGVRIAVAFVLTLIAATYFEVPERTWILITLFVVIGPISYLGNVLPRAWHRVLGTSLGAMSGIIGIAISQYSMALMYLWCAVIIFLSAYFALGKRPYVGILIGITLAVTLGAANADVDVAMWRGVDVTLGCIIAVLFCLIYPQRAFIHWRLRIANTLKTLSKVYHLSYSPNVIEKPNLEPFQNTLVKEMTTITTLTSPSIKETKLKRQLLDAIQIQLRNLLSTIELLNHSYWSDRESHLNMLWSKSLKQCQQQVEQELEDLAYLVEKGEVRGGIRIEETDEIIRELKDIIAELGGEKSNIYGYVWLNLKLIEDLGNLKKLLILALNLSQKS